MPPPPPKAKPIPNAGTLAGPPLTSTSGALNSVPCPHCGFRMNFADMAGEDSGGAGGSWGDSGLEVGATIDCDECARVSKIIGKQKLVVIKLAPA